MTTLEDYSLGTYLRLVLLALFLLYSLTLLLPNKPKFKSPRIMVVVIITLLEAAFLIVAAINPDLFYFYPDRWLYYTASIIVFNLLFLYFTRRGLEPKRLLGGFYLYIFFFQFIMFPIKTVLMEKHYLSLIFIFIFSSLTTGLIMIQSYLAIGGGEKFHSAINKISVFAIFPWIFKLISYYQFNQMMWGKMWFGERLDYDHIYITILLLLNLIWNIKLKNQRKIPAILLFLTLTISTFLSQSHLEILETGPIY